MPIIADTHVHLYPVFRYGKLFIQLAQNLRHLATAAGNRAADLVVLLTEREGQHVFRALREGTQTLGRDDLAYEVHPEGAALRVTTARGDLHILPGRQIVTAERIEILCLTADADIPDGLPAVETLDRILAADGVPVLSWAPGKWWFRRGRVIRALLERYTPVQLLLGDTTLRPRLCWEPAIMRAARKRGFRVVAGSDPLPFRGDDRVAGTYATWLSDPFDAAAPVQSVRAALRQTLPEPRMVGCRSRLFTVISRLRHNAQVRKP